MRRNLSAVIDDGSHVGVIGGGPAGSFFSYFLLQFAQRVDMNIIVDIYESRDFSLSGPTGCNMCAGVISESLIQALSIDGINLPTSVVQRGINSFVFHTDQENVTMYAPFHEMRIASVYRGGGPKGTELIQWESFDDYLLNLAVTNGANIIRKRVTNINWEEKRPQIQIKNGESQSYDLVVGAIGVNSPSFTLFEKLGIGYLRPKIRKTFNIEFELGSDFISNKLGSSMHAFLLNLRNLDFAALIPKGNYATMCLIGDNINSNFVNSFIKHRTVQQHLASSESHTAGACHCSPMASLGEAIHPFGDRVVLVGDCGISRLNKDGIGSAYRTAKAAAVTSLFRGISAIDFQKGYWPLCKSIKHDNLFGRIIYKIVDIIKRSRILTRGVIRMTRIEQNKRGKNQRMSMVLWDMFTGSAPYRDVFLRCLHPYFISGLIWNIIIGSKSIKVEPSNTREDKLEIGSLGKHYKKGELIIQQGTTGDCMYVVQTGQLEIIQENEGKSIRLAVLSKGDIFGEMALFQKRTRSATVRALNDSQVITVDKKIFLRRVHEDPSLAYSILQKMSQRIRELDNELTQIKTRMPN